MYMLVRRLEGLLTVLLKSIHRERTHALKVIILWNFHKQPSQFINIQLAHEYFLSERFIIYFCYKNSIFLYLFDNTVHTYSLFVHELC